MNLTNKGKEAAVRYTLRSNTYILGVFTEKPYSKPLEGNVVYIPIITLSHATSHDVKVNHGSLQSDWTSTTL